MQWLELREASRGIRPAFSNFAGFLGFPSAFKLRSFVTFPTSSLIAPFTSWNPTVLMCTEIKDI